MKRPIISIDEEACDGCGLCVPGCHEGAIAIVDGKARLTGESLCDGLGACIGTCPRGAITIEERDAEPWAEAALDPKPLCPGLSERHAPANALGHWPIQLHLINPTSHHFKRSHFMLAADCTAFSLAGFNPKMLAGRTLAIACPKLDGGTDSYVEKLSVLLEHAGIETLTVVVMEVPCCAGLLALAREALARSGIRLPVKHIVVGIDGIIRSEKWL